MEGSCSQVKMLHKISSYLEKKEGLRVPQQTQPPTQHS